MNLNSVLEKEEHEEVQQEKKEKWWTDNGNDRTYHFDPEDIEDAVICLVKPKVKFKKEYKLKHCSIVFHSLTDREQAELNNHLQEIENKGAVRWFRQIEEGVDANNKPLTVKTEREITVNVDSLRAQRLVTLAFYINSIDKVVFEHMSLQQRLDMLADYSTDFLNWISNNILIHFLGIKAEATKKFVDF